MSKCSSTNLKIVAYRKRIKEHNKGNVDSTRKRRPLELIYYEAYKDKSNAILREKFLKTTKGKIQLRKQLPQ